jgi:acetyltransferase-like isoleucine patch superfamily enzyme
MVIFGFDIHPTASIGLSLVAPFRTLRMGPYARIGHLNVARGMDTIVLGPEANVGHLNWIYAEPSGSEHLRHETDRRTELVLEEGAGLTSRHLVDCSAPVTLGRYCLVAGYHTQMVTHGIDMGENRQRTRPITVGEYSMVGTRCVLIGGASLPPRSALGAASMLRQPFEQQGTLYSGVPAVARGTLDRESKFFARRRHARRPV